MSRDRTVALGLVLGAVVSVQVGGALAATLIPRVGVMGSVTLRLTIAAVVLLACVRPRVSGHSPSEWATVVLFGLTLAGMNAAFYGSLARLPIGVAVTIEFIGPLVLAATASRRWADLMAVLLAAGGVVLVSGAATADWESLDQLGVGLALLAGAFWAAYIVLSQRAGRSFPALDGIALAMVVGAVAVAPFGLLPALAGSADADVLARGVGIALLSSAVPYSLELMALRRLSAQVFGILLSLEPAMAALAGLLVLGQRLAPAQVAGMVAVMGASALVMGRRPADVAEIAST